MKRKKRKNETCRSVSAPRVSSSALTGGGTSSWSGWAHMCSSRCCCSISAMALRDDMHSTHIVGFFSCQLVSFVRLFCTSLVMSLVCSSLRHIVGFVSFQLVSFVKEPYKRDDILQKRRMILRIGLYYRSHFMSAGLFCRFLFMSAVSPRVTAARQRRCAEEWHVQDTHSNFLFSSISHFCRSLLRVSFIGLFCDAEGCHTKGTHCRFLFGQLVSFVGLFCRSLL